MQGVLHMRRMLAVLIACALATIMFRPGPAFAHALPVEMYPLDGAELDESPAEIRIKFSEPIEAAASRLIVQDAQGQPIHGAHQSSPDEVTLVVTLPPLPNGVYAATWEVLSTDTHTTSGQFTFSVAASAPQTVPVQPAAPGNDSATPPPDTATAAAAPESGARPGDQTRTSGEREFPWVWVVIGTGLLILLGVGMRRR